MQATGTGLGPSGLPRHATRKLPQAPRRSQTTAADTLQNDLPDGQRGRFSRRHSVRERVGPWDARTDSARATAESESPRPRANRIRSRSRIHHIDDTCALGSPAVAIRPSDAGSEDKSHRWPRLDPPLARNLTHYRFTGAGFLRELYAIDPRGPIRFHLGTRKSRWVKRSSPAQIASAGYNQDHDGVPY